MLKMRRIYEWRIIWHVCFSIPAVVKYECINYDPNSFYVVVFWDWKYMRSWQHVLRDTIWLSSKHYKIFSNPEHITRGTIRKSWPKKVGFKCVILLFIELFTSWQIIYVKHKTVCFNTSCSVASLTVTLNAQIDFTYMLSWKANDASSQVFLLSWDHVKKFRPYIQTL